MTDCTPEQRCLSPFPRYDNTHSQPLVCLFLSFLPSFRPSFLPSFLSFFLSFFFPLFLRSTFIHGMGVGVAHSSNDSCLLLQPDCCPWNRHLSWYPAPTRISSPNCPRRHQVTECLALCRTSERCECRPRCKCTQYAGGGFCVIGNRKTMRVFDSGQDVGGVHVLLQCCNVIYNTSAVWMSGMRR